MKQALKNELAKYKHLLKHPCEVEWESHQREPRSPVLTGLLTSKLRLRGEKGQS